MKTITGVMNVLRNFAAFIVVLILSFTFIVLEASSNEAVNFTRSISSDFEEPMDIAISESLDIYVLDKDLAKVKIFSPDGKLMRSFGSDGSELGQMHKPESIALSQSGNIIVADTGNSRAQVFSNKGHFMFEIGNSGTAEGEFVSPNRVTVDQLGYIYITDISKRIICKYTPEGVYLETKSLSYKPKDIDFDMAQNMYVLSNETGVIVKYPWNEGRIKEITLEDSDGRNIISNTVSISIDRNGDIYLIDKKLSSIKKMSQDGKELFSFGSQGEGRGQFSLPKNITADKAGNILVADTKNKRVQMFNIEGGSTVGLESIVYLPPELDFDSEIYSGEKISDLDWNESKGLHAVSDSRGEVLAAAANKFIRKTDQEKVLLQDPRAIKVLDNGMILVADTNNHRLTFLNEDGSPDYYFGTKGKKHSEFNALEGVAVDKEGYIYVADTKNDRIQVFNKDGIYLREFGQTTESIPELGAAVGTFLRPKALDFNSKDQLYVLDSKNKRIQVFEKDGTFVSQIGGEYDRAMFDEPVDISIDENDYLYVADRGKHKIHILSPEGKIVMNFGSAGKGRSYFPYLSSVESSKGKIYVADYFVDKIKVFSFNPNIEAKEDDKLYLTKLSRILQMEDGSDEIRQALERKLVLEEARRELAEKLEINEDMLKGHVVVEAEEMLDNGQLKITVSVPKDMSQMANDINREAEISLLQE